MGKSMEYTKEQIELSEKLMRLNALKLKHEMLSTSADQVIEEMYTEVMNKLYGKEEEKVVSSLTELVNSCIKALEVKTK